MRALMAGEMGKLALLAGMLAGLALPVLGQDLNQRLQAMAAGTEAAPDRDDGRHVVFAHYMTCYFNSVEFYMQEIELAQRHGIDGFAMNAGEWTRNPNYIQATERMYEAAQRLDSGFVLMMSPDGIRHEMPDMLKRFQDHPNQFRWNGRPVMSSYGGGGPQHWAADVQALRDEGHDFIFVPNTHLVPKHKMTYSLESAMSQFMGQDHMDGHFYFAIDGTANDILRANARLRRMAWHFDRLFMAGLGPAYNSPNLRDFQGLRGYDALWRGLVRDRPDWVEIVTWNDYNEDSNLMPWRWQSNWQKQYVSRDESFLDATGYFARWFRSGREPDIRQDKIYYAYRNRSQWLRREWDWEKEVWQDLTMRGYGSVDRHRIAPDQIHDDVRDKVYATTVLTEPAALVITLAGNTWTFEQPAGMTHVEVPLAGGVPHFSLRRAGQDLVAFSGHKQIIDEATQTKENSPAGYHLANRTWTGGAAVGPVVTRLEAAGGDLQEGAEVVTVGEARGARNALVDNSGVRLAVNGLETATYNLRVRYSNPGDTEARLTLYADGPPRGERDYPYYIPLFLPPTADGELATVSLLWSLYDTTSYLMPVWRRNRERETHPLTADQGRPVIVSIELVKVEPTVEPERRPGLFPELVEIPGGSFTMGADDTVPDEGPAHAVTVSPFAIGKYPVTNAEFERFDPTHRQHRDGFSWRDREPVIYVSWFDAVNYCNWLSEQAGLSPSYAIEGRNVTFIPDSEGFRLPSEAEWEYVASGRGEGRRYPWGDDEPVAGYHGNFPGNNHFWPGPDPLVPNPNLPSDLGGGTMVVGTYPAGASRDGVMDLAGNVCTWVNDLFHYYTAEAKTNPHVWEPPSPYRSIRGASFGYYGRPLRVTDREFNHPVYGGYIYIGFRVALPEAGVRKLMD